MGLLGGLFGGGDSSSSTSTSDRRNANDNGSVGVTGDSNTLTVTMTDGGAVQQALALASGAQKSNENVIDKVLGANREATAWGLEAGYQALKAAEAAREDAIAAAQQSMSSALASNEKAMTQSYSFASSVSKDAYALTGKNMADVLGLSQHIVDIAAQQAKDTKDAYGIATDQVAKAWVAASDFQVDKVTADGRYMVIALVGIVAVLAFGKKG